MLMHGSQIETIGTPGRARIWNSTADADLMLYFPWWSEKKEKKCQDAQNWQPGEVVQLLCGMAIPKGVGRQAGQMDGEVSLGTAAHLSSAPWEERLPGEWPLWIISWLTNSGFPYLCRFSPDPEITSFSIIKQKPCLYICAWWLCTHLCVYRPICVYVYIYMHIYSHFYLYFEGRDCCLPQIVVFLI